jgi:hypothetical protein
MSSTPNKTQVTDASVEAFLAGIAKDEQRADALALRDLMAKVSGEPATMWGPSMIGFGSYHYRYESGREGDTFLVGFSPRSGKTTLYLNLPGGMEAYGDVLAGLGPHTIGKGCLYLKRLRDVDLAVLEDLIRTAVTAER